VSPQDNHQDSLQVSPRDNQLGNPPLFLAASLRVNPPENQQVNLQDSQPDSPQDSPPGNHLASLQGNLQSNHLDSRRDSRRDSLLDSHLESRRVNQVDSRQENPLGSLLVSPQDSRLVSLLVSPRASPPLSPPSRTRPGVRWCGTSGATARPRGSARTSVAATAPATQPRAGIKSTFALIFRHIRATLIRNCLQIVNIYVYICSCECFLGSDGEEDWTGYDCSLRACPK
jgi:hypothetical protein